MEKIQELKNSQIMKKVAFIALILGVLVCFFSCKEKDLSPNCPPCWDKDMICVEGACDCPDGYLVTWLNRTGLGIGPQADSFPKKFCIKPSKLTFMAYIPRFDCLDTFALRFIKDPYEFTDTTYSPTGVWVVPVLPSSVARLAPVSDIRIVNENGRKVTRVHIMGLEPTHGMGIQSGICTEMDSAGEYVGTTEASFLGYVTHKDTISGYIEITGATSTKKEWFGRRLEGVKLVRTVPY